MPRPQAELLRWYHRHKRDLPWRQTRDPYAITVSEIMLQQTQVARVVPFFQAWMRAFPDARRLARAPLDRVHRLWKGLGYPSRAERLRELCRIVVDERQGVWPQTPAQLQELPGIGPYTAGAIACFSFASAVPIVDTNVARVYARRDGLPLPIEPPRLWQHAEAQLARRSPIHYNNALMELGALVCSAARPACEACPWRRRCLAYADGTAVADDFRRSANPLRVASPKKRYGVEISDRRKARQHIVLALIHAEGKYLLSRRPAGVPEAGRWELPGGKREVGESDRDALARELREELGVELLAARPFVDWHHDAGDRYLSFHCYRCRLFDPAAARPLASSALRWVSPEQFMELDFPAANAVILDRFRRYHRLPDTTCSTPTS